jgi:hypothetical protein
LALKAGKNMFVKSEEHSTLYTLAFNPLNDWRYNFHQENVTASVKLYWLISFDWDRKGNSLCWVLEHAQTIELKTILCDE